jgi:hypothetical protein
MSESAKSPSSGREDLINAIVAKFKPEQKQALMSSLCKDLITLDKHWMCQHVIDMLPSIAPDGNMVQFGSQIVESLFKADPPVKTNPPVKTDLQIRTDPPIKVEPLARTEECESGKLVFGGSGDTSGFGQTEQTGWFGQASASSQTERSDGESVLDQTGGFGLGLGFGSGFGRADVSSQTERSEGESVLDQTGGFGFGFGSGFGQADVSGQTERSKGGSVSDQELKQPIQTVPNRSMIDGDVGQTSSSVSSTKKTGTTVIRLVKKRARTESDTCAKNEQVIPTIPDKKVIDLKKNKRSKHIGITVTKDKINGLVPEKINSEPRAQRVDETTGEKRQSVQSKIKLDKDSQQIVDRLERLSNKYSPTTVRPVNLHEVFSNGIFADMLYKHSLTVIETFHLKKLISLGNNYPVRYRTKTCPSLCNSPYCMFAHFDDTTPLNCFYCINGNAHNHNNLYGVDNVCKAYIECVELMQNNYD